MSSSNAKTIPCKRIFDPADPAYDESIRRFQGCPTIAVTRGGRIFLGFEPQDRHVALVLRNDTGSAISDGFELMENLINPPDMD